MSAAKISQRADSPSENQPIFFACARRKAFLRFSGQQYNFILCHEIGHMFLNHTECEGEHAYCQEFEADKISYKWILEGIDINNRPVARLGICIALLSSILMDKEANINGTKHPNSFIRLLKYLTWLKIDNNHELWALSLSVIGLWDSKYDIFADFTPKKELGYKERFVTLLTTLGISKNDL